MASNTPPYQMAANQSRTAPSDDFSTSLLLAFRSKAKAFAFTMAIMVILFVFYTFVHIFRDVPDKPWGDAFEIMPVGYLEVDVKKDILAKFFSPERSKEIVEELDASFKKQREVAFEERKSILDNAGRLARRLDISLPQILDRAGIAKINEQGILPATDAEYKAADLTALTAWFEVNRSKFYENKSTQIEYLIESLRKQIANEKKVVQKLYDDAVAKDYDLKFLWLYHDGYGWIFELVFWSLVGVLLNTLVSLSKATRASLPEYKSTDGNPATPYSATRFLLVFPQLLIAPVVALIVVAFVIAGVTNAQVNLSNLPWFLIFAFSAGFASERLTGILKEAINKIIPRFGLAEAKIDVQYGQAARKRLADVSFNDNKPGNFEEFKVVLKDAVKSNLALEVDKVSDKAKAAAVSK
ncbi:hypothetical protein [Kordiimonas laminariae]|uniref:hypothetical protein n=1 Tax=Kordiimonas laminariae TaxID=2917717 RepID=UPI001FF2FEA3|nr:hypothetical protein [Kordiimonas laminariae]MCK0068535.1 hypothetical protein [Kordiimonas laminariae]